MTLSKYILVHGSEKMVDIVNSVDGRNDLDSSTTDPCSLIANVSRFNLTGSDFFSDSEDTMYKTTIGLWDLGAWLGGLSRLVESMNEVQKTFVFYEVKATVPAGFISRPERIIPWLTEVLGRKLKSSEKRDIQNNLIADDYFELAEKIRKDIGIAYLVGITPSMVAGLDNDEPYWNHFSTFEKSTILASTYQLREFAENTGRPFEVFLAKVIISQILVAHYWPRLGFHEDCGCLFDYNADRVSLIKNVLSPYIEAECMDAIDADHQPAVRALVEFLHNFGKA